MKKKYDAGFYCTEDETYYVGTYGRMACIQSPDLSATDGRATEVWCLPNGAVRVRADMCADLVAPAWANAPTGIDLPYELWLALAHKAVDLDVTPDALAHEILQFMLQPPLAGGGPSPPDTTERAYVRSNRISGIVTLDCALSKTIQALLPVATISAHAKARS